MKKKFVKVLSVMMAMLTLVMTFAMPVAAADEISVGFPVEKTDEDGNYMLFYLTVHRTDEHPISVACGGQYRTDDVVPTKKYVYLQTVAESYYRTTPNTPSGNKLAVNELGHLNPNSLYRVATGSPYYGGEIYYFDQTKRLHRIESWMTLSYVYYEDSSEDVLDWRCEVSKHRNEIMAAT